MGGADEVADGEADGVGYGYVGVENEAVEIIVGCCRRFFLFVLFIYFWGFWCGFSASYMQ